MPSRTGYPGSTDSEAFDILTSANFAKMPAGWLGYEQVTSSQSSITTITDLTGLSVTVTVPASRRIRVTGSAFLSRTVADGATSLLIRESSTTLKNAGYLTTGAQFGAEEGSVVLTPSAGSHTYKLSLEQDSGTGSSGIIAAATTPAFILVEDLGSSS